MEASVDEQSDHQNELEVVVQSSSTCKYDNSCGVCHKTFSKSSNLIPPASITNLPIIAACKRSLVNHLRIHNNNKPYLCHICHFAYASNGSLRGHFLTHPEIQRKNCSKCNAVTYPGSYVQHSCTRLPVYDDYIFRDGRFICPKCGDAFDSRESYGSHRGTHIEQNSFICDICKVQFYKKGVFRKHMKSHLGDGVLTYNEELSCPQCDKKFHSSKSLALHVRVEHEGIRHSCHICSKDFKYAKSLRDHLDKHSKVKAYHCTTCNKDFNYKSSYDNHIKLHEPKNFKCANSSCDKEFITQSQLNVHQKMHSEQKEHQCSHCDKAYHLKKHLTRHLASHSDRNFICELCATEFTFKSSYTHHMSLHYQGKKFKCEDCEKAFATNYKLKKHLITHRKSMNHDASVSSDLDDNEGVIDYSFSTCAGADDGRERKS